MNERSSPLLHPWSAAQNILCVRLDTLGDVLMTTPAIRALKESRPGRTITLLTSPPGAAPAPYIPEIGDVLVYEAPWMKASPPRTTSAADHQMIAVLRERRFDAAVVFTVYSQNPLPAAMFCYLADIPLRLAHVRERAYHLLTDAIPEIEPQQTIRHEAQRQLDLVAAVGCTTTDARLSFRPPPAALAQVQALLGAAGLDRARPWLVLHPGVSAASRRYNPLKYAEAARSLIREDGYQIVLTGSAEEIPLVEDIQREIALPTISLAGQLNLAALGALLRLAPLLVSNNTGPVHVAAAVGTPVVVLYALTNPQHTPWQVLHRVLSNDVPCKFCYRSICPEGHHLCLEGVSPGEVVHAVRELARQTETTINQTVGG